MVFIYFTATKLAFKTTQPYTGLIRHICRNQYQTINLNFSIIIFIIMQIHFMIHIVYAGSFVDIFINSLLITIFNENLAFYILVFFELLESNQNIKHSGVN